MTVRKSCIFFSQSKIFFLLFSEKYVALWYNSLMKKLVGRYYDFMDC